MYSRMKGKRIVLRGQIRNYSLALFDLAIYSVVNGLLYFALRMFDGLSSAECRWVLPTAALMLLTVFGCRVFVGIYNTIWRYPSTWTYVKLLLADMVGVVLALLLSLPLHFFHGVRYFLDVYTIVALLTLASRFIYRLMYKRLNDRTDPDRPHVEVAIVGAGQLGVTLASELLSGNKGLYHPAFFIDRDSAKIGCTVCGLPVMADTDNIADYIRLYGVSEIIVAVKNLTGEQANKLYRTYSDIGCKVKIYDAPIHELEGAGGSQRVIREFQVEDLLFRKPLSFLESAAFRYYAGKTVMITGGGGSIGSELCRQVARCNPHKLVIVDIYENNAYDIQQELLGAYGDRLDLVVEIASVRDRDRLEGIFRHYRPDVVFHAAAHKHVPLMERSACEAIKNNVFGTYNTADMAEKYGVEKFILISTDKAVNPTNIMGASKRVCEMIVQSRADSKTSFAAVRFGNVLGSNGSVIPLFKRQIRAGGPVTITDKRIIRYFMTIPEASQLVMQAGAMAKQGELFVLDMGKPVRIYDLAVNMIRLSGFEPDEDIQIKEIGLRPGEKLYEELLMKSETLEKTENALIFIEKDTRLTREEIEQKLAILREAAACSCGDDCGRVKEAIIATVPTFREPEEINETAEHSAEMQEATV